MTNQLNWDFIINEAKKRRKALKITQMHLAKLADVTSPTVCKLEQGKLNIKASSVLKILNVLGMIEKRSKPTFIGKPFLIKEKSLINFPLSFIGHTGLEQTINCTISLPTLAEYFGLYKTTNNPVTAFNKGKSRIEAAAIRKFYAKEFREDSSILIDSDSLYP